MSSDTIGAAYRLPHSGRGNSSRFIVLKFSSDSLNEASGWKLMLDRVQACLAEGLVPAVVTSMPDDTASMLAAQIGRAVDKHSFSASSGFSTDKLKSVFLKPALLLTQGRTPQTWKEGLEGIERLLLGISLTGEAPARLRARILTDGERLTSDLARLWLQEQLPNCRILQFNAGLIKAAEQQRRTDSESAYLSAVPDADASAASFGSLPACGSKDKAGQTQAEVFVMPGSTASNSEGERVYFGHNGHDLSAAALSVCLQAARAEFWSGKPGFYSADPLRIPSTRLLLRLDYEEAQELASVGCAPLHPGAIAILAQASIEAEMHSSARPGSEATKIGRFSGSGSSCVKALVCSSPTTLVSLEDIGMWQQVGFLAKAFGIFARHGFSIDLVATSQSNVTVSLDASAEPLAAESGRCDDLLADLKSCCSPKIIAPCASLSLVGRKIRSNLQHISPAMELFEEEKVHLLSQAASDLNFTFVVDESQADRLLKTLHAQLFSGIPDPEIFGSSYQQEISSEHKGRSRSYNSVWWVRRRQELIKLADTKTPAYIYSREALQQNADTLLHLSAVDKVFFAMKANSCPDILRIFRERGLGFECVSLGEAGRIRDLFPDLPKDRILFTPNFAAEKDFAGGFELNAMVTLDNLQPLELWPEVFKGREVFLRLDLGHGAGHSRKVRTAGNFSKFGIPLSELDRAAELTQRLGVKVIGLHSHSGSGIKTADTWARAALELSELAERFPGVEYLDLGGGLGVPERRDLDTLDLGSLNAGLMAFKKSHPRFKICIEPGRFPVAQAGVLLARVCQTKRKGDKFFIGCDAGMQTLIRPALYGAYHEIVNLSRWGEPTAETADVVGPVCETGDILGRDRHLPETEPGDVMLIDTAGAYGYTMSSDYNLRPKAAQVLI